MLILSHKSDACLTISVDGILDEHAAFEFGNMLMSVELSDVKNVDLNFEKLIYIGSSGIGKLLSFYKKATDKDIKIGLSNVADGIYSLLEQLHLHSLFDVRKKAQNT